MSIPALLKGTANLIRSAVDTTVVMVGERITDGAPHGAYERGKGWYIGVYFAGFMGVSSASYELTYSVGVDITRVIQNVPSKPRGAKLLEDGELWDMAARVTETVMAAAGKAAVACNAALAGSWQDGKGLFREQFHTTNCGKPRGEGPDWILGVPTERQTDDPILVLPLTFGGLKWRKLLSELWVKP